MVPFWYSFVILFETDVCNANCCEYIIFYKIYKLIPVSLVFVEINIFIIESGVYLIYKYFKCYIIKYKASGLKI